MLTISNLKRWSINYYIDTAQAAEHSARDLARAAGGLREYYSERESRTPAWLLAGDTHAVAKLVGITDVQRVGGDADVELVARWLDDGITPNGAHGRAFGERGVHGFDLTFCSPKSVSLVQALRTDDVVAKAIADAHSTAVSEAMEYLTAHAGYTRVHNPRTGEKDLVRLPGLVAIAVLVGDAHQLAPAKARGGMFAQLCTDLPWAQHLSEVWRPRRAAASLALRNGGPASVRRAIGWYRTYERLHCGDAITMAADALAACRTDTAADRKSLLISDTTEMVDALNLRLHHDTVGANALTVAGARGHRIAVGDLIISRQNDNTIPLRNTNDPASEQNPVRNGNRWRVTAINPDNNGLIARRLDDNALASFPDDYLSEHITHGYAVTVHSAQGVTADTTHAVLGDTATRSLLYVAMSRGRKTNFAYLYHRTAEYEYGQHPSEAAHVMQRGSSQAAGKLLRGIVANDDE